MLSIGWVSYHTRVLEIKTSLASWAFHKDNTDSEVVFKQVAAVADVIFVTHGNPEISSVCECHEIH